MHVYEYVSLIINSYVLFTIMLVANFVSLYVIFLIKTTIVRTYINKIFTCLYRKQLA